MRVTWVTRSFLDYRIPVFEELNKLLSGDLHVIFSSEWTPPRVAAKLKEVLGLQAIPLAGERRIGNDARSDFANSRICIPYQPGLYSAIARTQPDLLIADGFFRWTPAALRYKLFRRTPLVICYERTRHTERHAQWYRTLHRRLVVRMTDAMCCNGQLCQEYTQSLGMPAQRITLGHMAADNSALSQQAAAVTTENIVRLRARHHIQGVCFLYIGRLIRLKGVHELLAAWNKLRISNTAATLVVAGDGPERESLETYTKECKLDNVRLLGAIPYEEIAQLYAMSDIFVIPTLEDNWSLVVPEAMACGLPVLCSVYNGCWPELVHNNENGWTFDPLCQTDTIDALQRALANQAKLAAMGEQSRRIVARYSPTEAAHSILRACQLAAGATRSGSAVEPASTK